MLKWYQKINPFYLYDQYKRNQNTITRLTNDMITLNELCRVHREAREKSEKDSISLIFKLKKLEWGLHVMINDKIRQERLLRETTDKRQLLESYIQIATQTLGGNPPDQLERIDNYTYVYNPKVQNYKNE